MPGFLRRLLCSQDLLSPPPTHTQRGENTGRVVVAVISSLFFVSPNSNGMLLIQRRQNAGSVLQQILPYVELVSNT